MESLKEYGPYAPDREQVLAVFSEFGLGAEESRTAMGLWVDERFRLADEEGRDSLEKFLVNIEIADMFLLAGDIDSAVDNYDMVTAVLGGNIRLSDADRDFLETENEKLGDRIDKAIRAEN